MPHGRGSESRGVGSDARDGKKTPLLSGQESAMPHGRGSDARAGKNSDQPCPESAAAAKKRLVSEDEAGKKTQNSDHTAAKKTLDPEDESAAAGTSDARASRAKKPLHSESEEHMQDLVDTECSRADWFVAGGVSGRASRAAVAHKKEPVKDGPILPVHNAKSTKLIDKRQIMYAVAVTLPVSLLASAAGVHVFAGRGSWAAGAGVCVWIVAGAGMVLNQYGKLKWELLAARHLHRLCLLGCAILLSFYTYRAYFPSEIWAFWLLFGIAVMVLGVPWVLGIMRADDVDADTT